MKFRLLPSALALALSTGAAFSADLQLRRGEPLYDDPPPAPLWTGLFVGLSAGGTWSGAISGIEAGALDNGPYAPFGYRPGDAAAASVNGALSRSPGGSFIGGGQVGYNREFGAGSVRFVLGAEADIQGLVGSSPAKANGFGVSSTTAPEAPDQYGVAFFSQTQTRATLDYIGTLRGRFGWLATPTLLLYGTGGLAYGGVNFSTAAATTDVTGSPLVQFRPAAVATSYAKTQIGWTAGGGFEWMIKPNWSARIEYLRYDLGSAAATGVVVGQFGPEWTEYQGAPAYIYATRASTHFSGNLVRAGVNYHLDGGALPLVAR